MHNLDSISLDTQSVNLQAINALKCLDIEISDIQIERMERVIIGLFCPSFMRVRIKKYPGLQPIPAILSPHATLISRSPI
jgi:hypothetical protein